MGKFYLLCKFFPFSIFRLGKFIIVLKNMECLATDCGNKEIGAMKLLAVFMDVQYIFGLSGKIHSIVIEDFLW